MSRVSLERLREIEFELPLVASQDEACSLIEVSRIVDELIERRTRTPSVDQIPDRLLAGIDRWIIHGLEPGSFLWSVLQNNLRDALAYADPESAYVLPALVKYLHNLAPAHCWGSPQNTRDWRDLRDTVGPYEWEPKSQEERALAAKRGVR